MVAYTKPEQKQGSKNTVQNKEPQKTVAPNQTDIPVRMKTGVENLSGLSFDDVRVHYNSDKPAQLQALAYTQDNQVHIAPGQEKHLGHELGHDVQQMEGKVYPTVSINDHAVNIDPDMKREAPEIGNEAVKLRAEGLYHTAT